MYTTKRWIDIRLPQNFAQYEGGLLQLLDSTQ